ncbi:hypothetical protein EDD85DRAFT_953377 [Armillaria nabsnona]|nr:hypothetical protein EDD85DRAFT_953377 [Armillaria nabsnona]
MYDRSLQVIFSPPAILVVCARYITLYTARPGPTPVAVYSYGWVDGASATPKLLGIRAKLTRALLTLLLFSNSYRESIIATWSPAMPRRHPWQASHRRMDPPT